MKKATDIMMWFLLFIALCMGAWAAADVYPPLHQVVTQTGLYQLVMQLTPEEMFIPLGSGQVIMMMICLVLLYLGRHTSGFLRFHCHLYRLVQMDR